MNNRLFLLGSVLLILFNHLNALAVENKILFKIDYKIITSVDIYNEITYLKITNPNSTPIKNKSDEIMIKPRECLRSFECNPGLINFHN